MARPRPIRAGDRVRIVNPRRVVRVGYPKQVSDYLPEVKEKHGLDIARLILRARGGTFDNPELADAANNVIESSTYCIIDSKAHKRILAELAHEAAVADGFGGTARTLHVEEVENLRGEVGLVNAVRSAKTGTYDPPGYNGYGEDYDWVPGGLLNEKTHRLAQVRVYGQHLEEDPWIEVTDLERIESRE